MATNDSSVKTTSARLLRCNIKGADCKYYCRKLVVRESFCEHFITAELTIYDNNNVINSLKLQAGDPVSIAFDAPVNSFVWENDFMVLKYEGEQEADNLKMVVYTITVVTSEYYSDRGNIVKHSTAPGDTGVKVIQEIWSTCGFKPGLVPLVTDTPIQTQTEPFQIHELKPFTAIMNVRNQMYYPSYPSGNVLCYREYKQQTLSPLEYLFQRLAPQCPKPFIQKATWGVNVRDIFESEQAIIYARAQTRNGSGGGSGVASTSSQGKKSFDRAKGILGMNSIFGAAMGGGVAGGSRFGGAVNNMLNNSQRVEQASDFTNKIDKERHYAALIKAAPQYNIRVPLQWGIQHTVGKGAEFKLLPPMGDRDFDGQNPGGLMLISDLIHEIFFDIKTVQGTTTFQLLKGVKK